jgi:hypothetical protein
VKNRSFGQTHRPIPWDPGYEVQEVPWHEWLEALREQQWADTELEER